MSEHALTRRGVLSIGAGAAAIGIISPLGRLGRAATTSQVPMTVVIAQTPWLAGFRGLVEAYEKETGNVVNLDVNPFDGTLQKQRQSVRAKEGQYDLLILNTLFFAEMYHGGFVVPLADADPGFQLDRQVPTFDDTVYWDAGSGTCNPKTGKLMSVPINPNIPLLYYRKDLYEAKGLKVPQAWDELLANAKALHEPPKRYGIVQLGARGFGDVSYDWWPYLNSFGGNLFVDEKGGDFTVAINSPQAKQALDFYIRLAKEAGHPNTGGISQAQVIEYVLAGKAAHAILVIAAWAQMDNPQKSAVVDKIDVALVPHAAGHPSAPTNGDWLGAIAHNVPPDRQRAAAAFLQWFQTRNAQIAYMQAGSPPVRLDVLSSDLSDQPKYRWMKPMAESLPLARQMWTVPEGAELDAVIELKVNQAITGELTTAAALNAAAAEIHKIMQRAGYKTGQLADLS
jgi:multiple sugar transport system substrate-binding protein